MPQQQMQTEDVDVKLPSGEMVTVRVPHGTSDDQVHMKLMQKMPEAFVSKPKAPDMQRVDLATGKPATNPNAEHESDLGAGVAKSITGMGANIFNALSKVPVIGKAFDQSKIHDMQEFSKPSNGYEQGGQTTADVASLLVGPGAIKGVGKIPAVARAAATGGLAGAQSGDPKDIALGAGGSIAGDVIGAGAKALGKVPSELDRASKIARSAASEVSGMENTKYKNAITGMNDAIKSSKNASEAVNNLTDHFDALPRSMQRKAGPVFDKLMAELGGDVSGGKAGMSKAEQLSEYMKHHALYTAGVGGLYGGMRHGDMKEAATGAALGAVAPAAIRAIPKAGPVMSPLMRTMPALNNQLITNGGQDQK